MVSSLEGGEEGGKERGREREEKTKRDQIIYLNGSVPVKWNVSKRSEN